MCTLIALHRCIPGAYLVVGANRDEYLDRPAEGPVLLATASGPIVAPRDLLAGGTWLGVNAAGLFAAVTNRPAAERDPTRRSRGLLVLDALEAEKASAAARTLAGLPERAYNPFNLFVADEQDAFAVVYEEKPRLMRLGPGAHVIGNADPDAREVPKVAWLLGQAEALLPAPGHGVLDGLAAILQSHVEGGDPLASACIHTDVYGTRSSTLMWLGTAASVLRHAEGAPCITAYEDFTPLLDRLDRRAEPGAEELVARGAS
jgi:uncharacterized protein with NRDE domain